MNITDILPYKNIHFIGVGGISMSGICEILISEKFYNISGSDNFKSNLTDNLSEKGVKIYIGQSASNVSENVDLIVYTAAIKEDNEEFKRAKELGIKMMERSEFLGLLMKGYKYPICISGTHGKTTTTSMVSEVFLQTDTNPTILLGGILLSIDSNFKVGDREYLIAETCEYCDSFLKFYPHSGIILNVEKDHVDYFNSLEQIYNSFSKFAGLIPNESCLVINSDIIDFEKIIKGLNCKIITYGENEKSNWKVKNLKFDENGCGEYTAIFNEKEIYNIKLNVAGLHNVYNSLSVCALANFYKIEKDCVEKGLENFRGTKRRFEYKGEINGIKIIDDYAHHPTEITATVKAAKTQKINKLWCVFQPHTYSRTKAFLDEFAKAFENADNIVLLDIYSAREEDKGEVHSKDLLNKLKQNGKNAIYVEDFECGKVFIEKNCQQGDMLITIGAGNVYLLGEMLLNK